MMKKYTNESGISGVIAFEIKRESILVEFKGGAIYEYSYASAGKQKVEKMKELALKGRGLSTFISRAVKGDYVK